MATMCCAVKTVEIVLHEEGKPDSEQSVLRWSDTFQQKKAQASLEACEADIGKFAHFPGVGFTVSSEWDSEARTDGSPLCSTGLTEVDVANLKAILGYEVSRNTVANYRFQWRNFLAWARGKDVPALPAAPEQVAAYLAERLEDYGHKPATLRMAAASIAFVHKSAGMNDPCASPQVKRTLRSATRKSGKSQKQAEALTEEAFDVIRTTARTARLGRGGRLERPDIARDRGDLDIALISLMRDAMLRVSEAAALTWEDLKSEHDGTGRLFVWRSKTDVEGEGMVLFVSTSTMADLQVIRQKKSGAGTIFGLRPNQISKRIKQAANAAGLGEGFSGHSPRVGMARDLARAGVELPSLMTAGRWQTPVMPAHYVRNEVAGKGAVAQFYGYCRGKAKGNLGPRRGHAG